MTKNFCMAQPFLGPAEDETVTNCLSWLLRKQFPKRARGLATQHRFPEQDLRTRIARTVQLVRCSKMSHSKMV